MSKSVLETAAEHELRAVDSGDSPAARRKRLISLWPGNPRCTAVLDNRKAVAAHHIHRHPLTAVQVLQFGRRIFSPCISPAHGDDGKAPASEHCCADDKLHGEVKTDGSSSRSRSKSKCNNQKISGAEENLRSENGDAGDEPGDGRRNRKHVCLRKVCRKTCLKRGIRTAYRRCSVKSLSVIRMYGIESSTRCRSFFTGSYKYEKSLELHEIQGIS